MFKFNPKGFSLILASLCFILTIFHVGCKESSKTDSQSSTNPGPQQPDNPKNNPEVDLTIVTAQTIDDENITDFKVSGACVNNDDGGGEVTLRIGSRRFQTQCRRGFYTFSVNLTQLDSLSNPVIVTVSQTVRGVTYTDSRQVPQGYRTDDPAPENPVVTTTIELIYPDPEETAAPFYITNPILKVNNRSPQDKVNLYSDRYCQDQLGNEVSVPTYDPGEPEKSTFAKFELSDLTPGKYLFYEKSSDASDIWTTVCNVGSLEYNLEPSPGAPQSPWLLLPVTPSVDRSLTTTPVIRVYGVTPGNMVSLHRTNHCNDIPLTSGPVPTEQSYIDLTSSSLEAGVHLLRAKTRNFYGWSRCSITGTHYTVLSDNPFQNYNMIVKGITSPLTHLTPAINVSNVQGGDVIHLYKDDCATLLGEGTVEEGATEVDITIRAGIFTEPMTYVIHGRVVERNGSSAEYACTTEGLSYELERPLAPTMTFESGLFQVGNDRTPGIVLSNLLEGDQVRVYRDVTGQEPCTTVIGSATVPSGATEVTVTSTSLPYNTYKFRSKVIRRSNALEGECSSDSNALDYILRAN